MFSVCGTIVSSKVVLDPNTGQSKGSGFVKFATADEAQVAIRKLDGEAGLLVKLADKDVGQGGGGRPAAPPAARAPSSNLYITGLPSPEIDQAFLNEMFEDLGLSVVRSRVIPDTRGTGSSAAMVQLASIEQADRAISELSGQVLPGQDLALLLVYAQERPASGAPPRPVAPPRAAAPPRPAALPRPAAPAAGTPLPLAVKYAGSERTPSDNLYISGLPSPQADQGLLVELFTGLGLTVVRSRIIADTKGTGSSAAMIQLASLEEAASALDALNGQVVQGLTPSAAVVSGAAGDRETTLAVKYAGGDGSVPSDNLYISGLPSPQVDQATLHQIFAGLELTVVRSKIIPDTRGFGVSAAMVQLASQDEAECAILSLNGELFPARDPASSSTHAVKSSGAATLRVKYAGGDGSQPSDNLYISGLPSPPPDQAALAQVFAALGLTVVRSKIIPDTRGIGISAAMVQLASEEEASSAILALNGGVFSEGQVLLPAAEDDAAPERQTASGVVLRLKYAGGDGSQASDNLYITGLPSPPPDPSALDAVFANLGLTVVRSRVMADTRGTGTCTAMVQLASQEEAASAIASLSGEVFPAAGEAPRAGHADGAAPARQDAGSPTLWVKYAGGDRSQPSDNLYLAGLPSPPPDEAALNEVFFGLGLTVLRSKVIPDTRGTGISAAMVQLASQEEAESAIMALNGEPFPDLEMLRPAKRRAVAPPALPALPARPARPAAPVARLVPPPARSPQPVPPPVRLALPARPARPVPPPARLGRPVPPPARPAMPALPFTGSAALKVKYAGGEGSQPSDNLYISGLPSPAPSVATLNQVFVDLGLTVLRSKVIPDTRGLGVSAAMVQLASQEEAASAIESLNGGVFQPAQPLRLKVKYAGAGTAPCDNLYISGLPNPAPSQAALNQMFADMGLTVVRSKVIPDTRGFGNSAAMVQLASQEEAAAAIESLSGLDPWSLGAAAADGPAEAAGAEEAGQPLLVKYRGEANMPSETLYITGLPSPQIEVGLLHQMFEEQGWTVAWSKVIPDTRGQGSSAAMVQLGSLEEAADAIALWNGQQLLAPEAEAASEAPADEADAAHSAALAWAAAAGADLRALRPKYAGDGAPSDNLYISGLPSPLEPAALLELFTGMGLSVVRSRVIPDTRGYGNSAAMVQLASLEQAALAMSVLQGA